MFRIQSRAVHLLVDGLVNCTFPNPLLFCAADGAELIHFKLLIGATARVACLKTHETLVNVEC